MQNGLYVALSAQVALERRLETIADNVANMNTVGYRATGVSFETEMARAGDARLELCLERLGFYLAAPRRAHQDRQFARFRRAGRRLVWNSDAPRDRPTRATAGRRSTNPERLRTLNGDPILDAGGAPILVDSGGGPLTVSADGMITQNGRQVGAIGLFAIDPTRHSETGGKLERRAR